MPDSHLNLIPGYTEVLRGEKKSIMFIKWKVYSCSACSHSERYLENTKSKKAFFY